MNIRISAMLYCLCLFGLTTATAQENESKPNTDEQESVIRIQELDKYWQEVSRAVGAGDFQAYKATCHPEGVLVSLKSGKSYPLSQALERWEADFQNTKTGKIKASVEFRFGQRLGDKSTAHETGIFRYTVEKDGNKEVFLIHLDALLVKRDCRWQIMMEYQKSEATVDEWNALAL